MAYAILRTAKLKEVGHIAGSLSHTFRTRETPNADKARAHLNENHGPETPDQILAAIKDRLPEKIRKNGVRCIEYFIGGSPEHFQSNDGAAYFEDAKRWLIERHGAENVISTHVHRDETTPHMVAYVVPITADGKLSARHFLGGPEAMRELQTDFAERVGKRHGLERGIEGSKAKHQTIAEYYHRAQAAQPTTKINYPMERQKGLMGLPKEADHEFAERVAKAVYAEMAPTYVQGRELPALKKRLKEVEATNKKLLRRVREVEADADKKIALERSQAKALVAQAQKESAPWYQLLQGLSEQQQGMAREMVSEMLITMQRALNAATQKVVGIFDTTRSNGKALIRVNEGTADVHSVEASWEATDKLKELGVGWRDLVEINAFDARILARRHEHEEVIGKPAPTKGRDGKPLERAPERPNRDRGGWSR